MPVSSAALARLKNAALHDQGINRIDFDLLNEKVTIVFSVFDEQQGGDVLEPFLFTVSSEFEINH